MVELLSWISILLDGILILTIYALIKRIRIAENFNADALSNFIKFIEKANRDIVDAMNTGRQLFKEDMKGIDETILPIFNYQRDMLKEQSDMLVNLSKLIEEQRIFASTAQTLFEQQRELLHAQKKTLDEQLQMLEEQRVINEEQRDMIDREKDVV